MGSGIKAGQAFVEVGIGDKISAGLNAIKKKFSDFGKGLSDIGKSMMIVGGAITAPFVGAVLKAANLEKTMNKFNAVFGANATAVKAWGDEYANQIGRSKGEIAGFLAGSQQLLVPLGFAPGAAEEMSKQITKLTMDIASFNNVESAEAHNAIVSALLGRTHALKEMGVAIDEATVKQILLNNHVNPEKATEAQKAWATLQVIMASTSVVQGDAARSAGSFTNQMASLKASVSGAASSIGSVLLPVVTPLVGRIRDAIKASTEWIMGHKQLIIWTAQLGAALTVAGAATFAFGKVITGVVSGISTTVKVFSLLTSPVGLVIVAIAALGAAFVWLTARGSTWGEKFKSILDSVVPFIEKALATIQGVFSDLWTVVQPVLTALAASVLMVMETIGSSFRQAGSVISDAVSTVWGWIQPYIKPVLDWMVGAICGAIDTVGFAFKNWQLVISYVMVGFAYNCVKAFNEVIYFFTDVLPATLRWFLDNWKDIFTTAWNFFKTFATNIGKNLTNLWGAIKGFFSGEGWNFEWTGLLDGFENTIKKLPEIAERQVTGIEKTLGNEVDSLSGEMKQAWQDYQDAKKQKEVELQKQNEFKATETTKGEKSPAMQLPQLTQIPMNARQQASDIKAASTGIFSAYAIQSLRGDRNIQLEQLDAMKAIEKNTEKMYIPQDDYGKDFGEFA